jgi:excisionase family DNA binding protein
MSVFEHNYIRPSEIARRLDLHRTTVYKLIKDGELPAIRIGHAVRVPVHAYEAYLNRREAEPVSQSTIRGEDVVASVELESRLAGFESRTGCDPFEFIAAWKRGDIEDTPENAEVAMDALALRSVLQREPVSV